MIDITPAASTDNGYELTGRQPRWTYKTKDGHAADMAMHELNGLGYLRHVMGKSANKLLPTHAITVVVGKFKRLDPLYKHRSSVLA